MLRERALRVVLVVVGLFFFAGVYLVIRPPFKDETFQMMLSLYITLGIFLLLAARAPSLHRSLIAFTAWSSFAHAGIMTVQAFRNRIPHEELMGSVVLAAIGLVLLVLSPARTAPATKGMD